jgi:signal transduction histidine kinase
MSWPTTARSTAGCLPWRILGSVLALLALMACGPAWASSSRWLQIDGLPGVRARVAIAIDTSETSTLDELLRAGAFIPVADDSRDVIALPFAWLRIDLSVPEALRGQSAWLRVVPSLIYRADLYTPDGVHQESGLGVPLAQQSHPSFPPLFRVALEPTGVRVYLRVASAVPQLTHLSLLSAQALSDEVRRDTLRQGLFLGAAVLMLLLALMNWVSTGQPVYRDYAVYITAWVVFMLFFNGYIPTYVLTNAPIALARLPLVFGALVIASTILFSLQALEIARHQPRLARVLRWIMACALLSAFTAISLPLIDPMAKVLWLGHLVVGLLLLGISLQQALKLRTAQAWVVFAAYLSFTAFEKAPLLSMGGVLPVTAWIVELHKIGLVFQMLLTHLQLVIRLREQRGLEHQALAARLEAQAERTQRQDLIQFLGMFGHEVRTPLAIIDAATQSLEILPGADMPQNQQRHKRIRAAVERLSVLSREALSRERIEAGGWNPQPRAVQLNPLIDEMLALHGVALPEGLWCGTLRLPMTIAGQPGGALELTAPEDLPELQADPDLLQVALGNLLDNARKYADAGSVVKLHIKLLDAVPPGPACIPFELLSQGCVLSPTELAQVFEKYWRRDEHRNVAGAGLGLHLVRSIAQAHSGSVQARSLPGRWSSFSIHLPLRLAPQLPTP